MSFSEWKKYCLGDIVDIKHGFAFKGEFFSQTPTNDILLSPGNFKIGGGFKADKFKYYKGKYPADYILNEGDVIVTMTDLSKEGDTLGYSAKVPKPENVNYLHNQRLGLLQFKKKEFDKDFIYWLLRTKEYQLFVVNGATGTTVKHTSPTRIREYEFNAPDLKTQQRIASILSSLDDAIELNQQINKTLEEMAKAIFKEWFVDFNFPNATGKFQETEIGKIPVGWKVGTIESILFHSKDSVNPSKQPDEDFYHYSIPAYDEGNNPSVEKGSTILSNKFQVKGNSILVSKLNPRFPRTWAIGEIEEERSICSTEFQVLVPRKPFYYSFGLWLFAQTFVIDKMKGNATGTSGSHQRVRPQDILDIDIALPTDEILKLYHDTVSAFSKQMDDNKKGNQSLINLRDTLLPKLMKGEININL